MMPAITADTEETHYGKSLDLLLLRRFFGFTQGCRRWMTAAILLLPLAILAQILQPLVIRTAVDHYLAVEGRSPELTGLGGLVLLLGVLVGVQFVIGYGQAVVNAWLGQRIILNLRRELFRHLLCQDAAFFSRESSGRLTNRVANDTEAVNQMVSAGMISLVGDLMLLLGIAVSMAILSPQLALIAVLALPLIVALTAFIGGRLRQLQRQGRLLQSRLAGRFTEEIEGHQVVRLFHRQERNRREYDQLNRGYLDTALQSNHWEAWQFSLVETASTLIIAGFFWYGDSLRDDPTVTIGTLVAFIDYIRRIFMPIRDLSTRFTTMQAAMTALERIFATLDQVPVIPTPLAGPSHSVTSDRPATGPAISFQGVNFRYDQQAVLTDISFEVRSGEKVALVGPTGSGKSTLIRLINRQYDVTEGRVLIDGQEVGALPLAELRAMVGMVQQETFLFNRSIADNISLADPRVDQARVVWAAEQTGADSFINELPEGYDTLLAERGGNLSTGQRQLLGIARVLAFNPRILVMDEATSSVDTISERLIREAMVRLQVGRTSVVVAHRLGTILDADRIVVLSQGRMVESGTHGELLARGGLYAKLYALHYAQGEQEERG